ncbi:MAG: hypothetical protein JEZ06_12475 [Anaerolineaceae bacterium]|nr:hypothetical protein [Anaerolineaceae bacterium]
MDLWILDDSLWIKAYYDPQECDYDDNICVILHESCPEDEKILSVDEVHLSISPMQARKLGEMFIKAAEASENTLE